ncbi:O-antigen ligase family protein [Pseudonocardia sp.]|uniref:O-antigen ligase family protein n=1 Tax=Pseudonocardia sp. TaxID=60912 RepID=UPI003D0FD810
MVTTWDPPRDRRSAPTRLLVLALGAAAVHGTVNRGGFHAGDAAALLALLAAAAAARVAVHPRVPHPAAASSAFHQGEFRVPPAAQPTRPVVVAILALLGVAAWVLVRGDGASGLPAAALACGLAAAAWAATGLDTVGRRVLHAVVIACGLVVASTGWVGVALHVEPLALVSSGLWRASSTLTYANAAAAFLVAVLLLAVAVLPAPGADRSRPLMLVTTSVLLLGLVATMSRAGLLTLAVGVLVLLASPPHRARLRTLWPVLPAVAVAAAGLLPALPEAAGPGSAQPLPAVAGLAAGLAILVLDRRAVTLLVGAAAVAVVMAVPAATFADLASTRLSATSTERGDLARVTAAQFLESPLTGIGPGRLDLVYVDHRGVLVRAEYTHDEYLQMAAETGVIGLALTGTALIALLLAAARRWRDATGPPALAILAAFALHSAADFLWHIPVLPLLVLLCVVPLLTRSPEES